MKHLFIACLLLASGIPAVYAQEGEWYTWSTGQQPVAHLTINGDELVLERTEPASKEGGIKGRKASGSDAEHMEIVKKVKKNDRTYIIVKSFDGLFFLTTFQYFKAQDSLLMYCADGVDDGYKSAGEAVAAINKDQGKDFAICLFPKDKLTASQRGKVSVSKISQQDFGTALQTFSDTMDKFWQDRGYGKFEPYHSWMNLIYGNAFANAFDEKYNKLSLTGRELQVPIQQYGNDKNIHRLLESAGFLKE